MHKSPTCRDSFASCGYRPSLQLDFCNFGVGRWTLSVCFLRVSPFRIPCRAEALAKPADF